MISLGLVEDAIKTAVRRIDQRGGYFLWAASDFFCDAAAGLSFVMRLSVFNLDRRLKHRWTRIP